MPTFCRHGRFLERCPICSKTLPEHQADGRGAAGRRPRSGSTTRSRTRSEPARGPGLRVRREARSADDGYRSELVPGLRSSADAERLAGEIGFAAGRLAALAVDPPGVYEDAMRLAAQDLELATWTSFLIAYLSPLEGPEPFVGIREALVRNPRPPLGELEQARLDLDGIPLGPRSSHEPSRGVETLRAYVQWVERGGSSTAAASAGADPSQATAFRGDPGWTPERRFERLFERLAIPGLGRTGRYELLITLGRLGLYPLLPDSLHLRGIAGEDATTAAAKRVFGIADPLLLERRARSLADAAGVPIEALDLALANWAADERAGVGFGPEATDEAAVERARARLGA